jgi:hypothetical protein
MLFPRRKLSFLPNLISQSLVRKTFELFVLVDTHSPFSSYLSTGEKGLSQSGRPLHYKESVFHRIIPGFMCQGVFTSPLVCYLTSSLPSQEG